MFINFLQFALFHIIIHRPPSSTLFPYTTLFRSFMFWLIVSNFVLKLLTSLRSIPMDPATLYAVLNTEGECNDIERFFRGFICKCGCELEFRNVTILETALYVVDSVEVNKHMLQS